MTAPGDDAGVTVAALLADARRRLRDADVADADLDARILVANVFDLDAADLVLRERERVDATKLDVMDAALARRAAGEPVHRILGRRSFYAHDFRLSPATLEPRPDTETLVDLCHAPITRAIAERGRCLLADVGTGTGAIAVSLLALFPHAEAIAIDIAPEALETARGNAAAAGVLDRFHPLLSNYLAAVHGPVDLVVSNPPYIPSAVIASLPREVREHDPLLALDGGADGLDAYRAIAGDAARILSPDGMVALEIGAGQRREVEGILAAAGFRLEAAASDLAGIERALLFVNASPMSIECRYSP